MARTITGQSGNINMFSGKLTVDGNAGAGSTPGGSAGNLPSEIELHGDPNSTYARRVFFRSSGVWTVPEGVTRLRVTCMGGRGGHGGVEVYGSNNDLTSGGGSASCLNITAGAGMSGQKTIPVGVNGIGLGGVGTGGIVNGIGGNGGNGGRLVKEGNYPIKTLPEIGKPGLNHAPAGGNGADIEMNALQNVTTEAVASCGGGGGGYAMGYRTVTPGQSVAYTVNGFGDPYVMIEY